MNRFNSIRKGFVFFVNLGERDGSIQKGRRPCVVVQNNTGNKYSPTVIMVPITSKVKKEMPTHVDLSDIPQLVAGSKALLEQPFTINKEELGEYICKVSKAHILRINKAMAISFGLAHYTEWNNKKSSVRNRKSQNGKVEHGVVPFGHKGGIEHGNNKRKL